MANKQNTFHEKTISNTDFQEAHTVKFPFTAVKLSIVNDDLKDVYYSFNGRDIDGKIKWDDHEHSLSGVSIGRIWFKADETANIRIFAWASL